MQYKNTGFSLIEILIGLLIVSIVMIAGFQSLAAVGIGKVKLIETTRIEKEAFFSTEKFFEMIKKGGTIDYEEYWNRYSYDASYGSGHYLEETGFGNFGRGATINATSNYGESSYYCLSGNASSMGTGGCLSTNNVDTTAVNFNIDHSGEYQRYGQYELQFIDHNSDLDNDQGNEDGSSEPSFDFRGDDDDLHLGLGPVSFTGPVTINKIQELYLINASGNERTFFRWNVEIDPNKPPLATCDFTLPEKPTGEGCLGHMEFLRLVGVDVGHAHDGSGIYADDGIIDTWYIHPDFANGVTGIIASSTPTSYWQSIFPSSIHVKDVEFYIYPNIDLEYSWRDANLLNRIAPYLQMKMVLQPSWKEKRKIKGKTPQVDMSTTIELSSLDFQ